MKEYVELNSKDLIFSLDEMYPFNTTKDIKAYDTVIGQKRAVESIELGLNMPSKEYNIFISGKTGTGKTGYLIRKIEDYAKNMSTPEDWCYVFNFENQNNPCALSLKTGTAQKFKEDMAAFIKYLVKEVPVYFNSANYERERNTIIDKYQKSISMLSRELNIESKKRSFNVKQYPTGEFVFIPIREEKEITAEEYNQLDEEEKNTIENYLSELRNISTDIFKQSRQLQKKMDEELKHLDDKIADSIIAPKIDEMINNYGDNVKVHKYLDTVKNDIIENIGYFFESEEENSKNDDNDALFLRRYDVNVLVCNTENGGAPVVFADSSQVGQIFGNIEYENKLGSLITDFTLIRPGYMHKANGGFLIIKADQLLKQPSAWELLKKCINLELISINTSKYNVDILPISTLNPEDIPQKTKVILIGSHYLYSLLLERDLEFEKIFKIKAEFDSEIEKESSNTEKLIGFLSSYIEKNNLRHITRDGVVKLLKHSSRLAENRNYFSASMSKILNIVDIANYFAAKDESAFIEQKQIEKALAENNSMHSLYRKKTLDRYKYKKYVVDLNGSKVGQINGLSVIDYGDCVIGQQHRITVSTFAGRKGIINIEREADMSGSIHDKGIMILAGFVGELIGRDIPISFNANIVFEQLYSGIEGDSASAAELLALLSSLSGIPIKQSLAITGSVNQKGEIQPIGGVNDKIEGYFDICSLFGLNGSHGVLIPSTNVDDLVLKQEIIEAVDKGLFHIYSVQNISQCIEILFDDPNINIIDNYNSEKYSKENPTDSNSTYFDCRKLEYIKEKILVTLKWYNDILKGAKID